MAVACRHDVIPAGVHPQSFITEHKPPISLIKHVHPTKPLIYCHVYARIYTVWTYIRTCHGYISLDADTNIRIQTRGESVTSQQHLSQSIWHGPWTDDRHGRSLAHVTRDGRTPGRTSKQMTRHGKRHGLTSKGVWKSQGVHM